MAVFKRGNTWWYKFRYAGREVRESAKTTRKTVAVEAERNRRKEFEKALAGMPVERRETRIQSVSEIVAAYLDHYPLNHRASSVVFARGCLNHVSRLLGRALLLDLTEPTIHDYIKARLSEGVTGRTINTELGELSRAIGKPWRALWPKVRKLEERHDVGRALAPDEEQRLLEAAGQNRSPNMKTLLRVALMTGMRAGELTRLTWGQVDFRERIVTVGRAKSAAGTGRTIPMNTDLFRLLGAHAAWFTEKFGQAKPEHFVFPFGAPYPSDPGKPTTELKTSWTSIRTAAGVECRWHDLRHTACTKMAEAGVPESTMLSLMGHMSRAMLERYSHIRMAAKREAVEALSLTPKEAQFAPVSDGVGTKMGTPGKRTRVQ
ncbi:MAG: tyrosine-type recombinase/integrase [Bryobacteraceae bacterium]